MPDRCQDYWELYAAVRCQVDSPPSVVRVVLISARYRALNQHILDCPACGAWLKDKTAQRGLRENRKVLETAGRKKEDDGI
jgi:hypothetical protein